ncbi:MAG: hypothetical protein JWN46_925 [Acidimicrobiales bacterium]|nr:hypothetical protein [Acidimicrobiales bacterium]
MTAPTGDGRRTHLRWWREVLIAGGFYLPYTLVRNQFGAGTSQRSVAFRHARSVIHLERALGLFFEPRLQRWYLGLPAHGLIRFWNIFYGTLHFVVTIGVLVFAFRRVPDRYRFLRTTLAATTAVALVGFATFSLMPPRLLDDNTAFGACAGLAESCHGYGVQDTIAVHGGLWQFGKGAMSSVSNQFAAMPSLHFGWSSWCALTLLVCLRRNRWRWLALLYPAATLFCILVTGNHYWIDALAGAITLATGALIATAVERLWHRVRPLPQPAAESLSEAPAP